MTEASPVRSGRLFELPLLGALDRPPIGRRVGGRYRVVAEVGAGAFGTVCLAEDEVSGARVALRLLPPACADRAGAGPVADRLTRSIVPASMAHPALVRVLDAGRTDSGRPFIATEFVQGRRLSDLLAGGEALDVATALRLAVDLGGAVETLHNMGLVHGALRSDNVMLLDDGRAKLMDLELIDLRDAPEPPTEKTDIYDFAVVAYEMLCGAKAPAPPRWPRDRRRVVPHSVRRVIDEALSAQPERRPFMPALLNGLVVTAPAPGRGRRRFAATLGAAALAAVIAIPASSLLRPAPVARSVYRVLPADSTQVPTKRAEPSTARIGPPAPSARDAAPPAAIAPAPARPPAIKAERGAPPPGQEPTASDGARPSASRSDEGYDPGAVIDWLLSDVARRGK